MQYQPMVLNLPRTEQKGACMSVIDAEAADASQKGATVCEELADDCRCMSIIEAAEASSEGSTVSEEVADDCRSM